MNEEDSRMRTDEGDAEPQRFPTRGGKTSSPIEKEERREDLSRHATATTTSSSRTSAESVEREEIRVSRMPTQRDSSVDLARHQTTLSRIQTGRSQQSHTIGSTLRSRTATRLSKKPLPGFGAGKPYPPELPEREEYVVEFDGPGDPLHAQNWPLSKKIIVAVVLGFTTLSSAFGSSIFSTATLIVAEQFGFSREVGILGGEYVASEIFDTSTMSL